MDATMLDVDAALALIHQGLHRGPTEALAPRAALGRVLAQAVYSGEDLPPFDNAAMDGFALPLGARTAQAGEEFAVQGEQAAGDAARSARVACAIMTGARLPDGLDAVVPLEQVRVLAHDVQGGAQRIVLTVAVAPGQHCRRRGEDICRGEPALPAGCRIGPPQLALLAGIGCAQVSVVKAPRLTLFCTGRELVDDPARALGSGEIRNSNGPYLAAAAAAAGTELLREVTVADEPASLQHAITDAVADGARLILSTGAVSAGRYDFVPEVLGALRADIVFHKLRMRPGKPLLFARLPGGTLYFGLPGNPASCAVGFRFFVCAAVRALLGLAAERPWRLPLVQEASKKAGFALYQKASLTFDRDGRAGVRLLSGQESFKVHSLAHAQGWAMLPAAAEHLPAGASVDFHGSAHWGLHLDTESAA